ncbi:MAG: type I-F CRISPR-associated endoribonuclease Cas6/Csy4 [Methylobacter sp.]|uniref:type I-F CRISPR-associated endoribonuclease Cas6/Csy4 n=1 Tax=Methylobacter sp. TaxID=2051955 RepID=UPI0025846629|nr:type I-F CRISPR-associated endoribonuclease Cas6/Csy4 [Methylobacter sp.]MCL7421367.1 type I-F CRISPR-associated endoribonuclease Cas6/Csy4 [Methylobacter sp.]
MMKYYIDITLLPGPEIPLYFLWEKVYQQLHLAFVENQEEGKIRVGVAFPKYDKEKLHLGNKLRLLATDSEILRKLNLDMALARLVDYVHITQIREVPEKIDGYAFFKRIQLKSSNERLIRRRAKRQGISYEQAASYFEGRKENYSIAPFIHIKSHSTGKRYRLIIEREDTVIASSEAVFSTYGLSNRSTVPLFQ